MHPEDTTPERWAPIPGYEGYYDVSDRGRVRGVDRLVPRRNRRAGTTSTTTRAVRGRILSTATAKREYPAIVLMRDGGRRRRYVHQLVLLAFVGPCPDGMEGCHEDGTRTNNRLINLRWDTPKANQADRALHGTSNRGEASASALLTAAQAIAIREEYAAGGVLQRELGERYGVSRGAITNVVLGTNWKHVGGPRTRRR